MKLVNGQLISEDSDAQEIKDGMDEAEFVRLSQKYMHHDSYKCYEHGCLICLAHGYTVNGQTDIDHAEQEKNRDHALDNVPF